MLYNYDKNLTPFSQRLRKKMTKADKERGSKLFALGITVLRYTNSDINKRFRSVCDEILQKLELNYDDLNL